MPDSRDAYEAEIARLQAENEALRRGSAPAPSEKPPQDIERDLDRALGYADYFYRRFKSLIDRWRSSGSGERL